MPRANRHYLPGQIWHITQRCHKKEFLLKFAKDRARLRYWIFQAKKRFGLSVLNYTITSNHIHILVIDKGLDEISKSMQLISGRTAQEYNNRKKRKGAFWGDRYHATAVDTGDYLARCLVYTDLNMVRAGVVTHPIDWLWCGYHEIQSAPSRYKIIDTLMLLKLFDIGSMSELQVMHKNWVTSRLLEGENNREEFWSNSLAVGNKAYVTKFKNGLDIKTHYRTVENDNEVYTLKESSLSYNPVLTP